MAAGVGEGDDDFGTGCRSSEAPSGKGGAAVAPMGVFSKNACRRCITALRSGSLSFGGASLRGAGTMVINGTAQSARMPHEASSGMHRCNLLLMKYMPRRLHTYDMLLCV